MSNLLNDCGEALYGRRWQSDLSRDLNVADRTIRRWASGVDDPPDGVWVDLMRLTQERAVLLESLKDRLKTAGITK